MYEKQTPFPSDPVVLIYAGNLGRDRLPLLLNLAKVVSKNGAVRLLVAGFGELEGLASKVLRNLPKINYLGRLPRNEVMRQTALSDCVVLPYDSRLYNNVIALPNRFFEALSLSKPLLAQKGTCVAQIIEDSKCGIATDFSDLKEIRRSLKMIEVERHVLLKEMSARARQLYETKYSWALTESRFMQFYQQIVAADQE